MKRILTATVAFALLLTVNALAQDAKAKETNSEEKAPATEIKAPEAKASDAFKDDKEKVSYAIGLQIGESLKMLEGKIDVNVLKRGLDDKFNGKTPLLGAEETEKIMQDFSAKMREEQMAKQQEQMAKQKEQGEANQKAGEAFLAANKAKAGVKVTESGLQYKVVKEGDGATPGPDDTVKVNYRGTLIDGKEFDSSYKRNEPLTIPVKGVIPGWTEALQMMKVGSKYELYIPSDLAYGPRGPGEIGPNSALIFEVELLGIEKPADEKAIEDGIKLEDGAKPLDTRKK